MSKREFVEDGFQLDRLVGGHEAHTGSRAQAVERLTRGGLARVAHPKGRPWPLRARWAPLVGPWALDGTLI